MSRRSNLYIGKSGQMVVMAEFLARGYNVAIPEVDVGDDVFVVRDDDGDLSRIQVKTARAVERRGSFSAQFNVPLRQLSKPVRPDLDYVMVVRRGDRWSDFLLFTREKLFELYRTQGVGALSGKNVLLHLSFLTDEVLCCRVNLQTYRNNWSKWSVIEH